MENQRNFTIKRGMIFNLTEPAKSQPEMGVDAIRKTRPYMVVSNDGCNNCSFYCNAAPLTTQPKKEERYYRVPFPKCDEYDRWVNVSNIVLVPVSMCNRVTYNPFLSRVALDDEEFQQNLNAALMKQFGLVAHVAETAEKTVETVTTEATQTAAAVFNLPVNITISIAGYDTQSVTLSPTTSVIETPVAEPVVETKQEPVITETPEIVELTPEVIRTNYKAFGGKMTYQQIADMCGTKLSRVYALTQKIIREASESRRLAATAIAQAKQVEQQKVPVNETTVPTKKRNEGRASCYIHVSDEALRQCRVLGGTMTNAEVAKAVGVSRRTLTTRIAEYLKEHSADTASSKPVTVPVNPVTESNLTTKRKHTGGKKLIRLDEATLRRARVLGGDLTVQDIADILGVGVATVRRRITDMKNGVTGECKLSDKAVNAFILTNSKAFGGTMTNAELSKALNIGVHRMDKLVASLKESDTETTETNTGRSKYKFMTLETKKRFLMDCKSGKYSISQLLAKYGSYGINSSEHLMKIVKRLEKELKVGNK